MPLAVADFIAASRSARASRVGSNLSRGKAIGLAGALGEAAGAAGAIDAGGATDAAGRAVSIFWPSAMLDDSKVTVMTKRKLFIMVVELRGSIDALASGSVYPRPCLDAALRRGYCPPIAAG